jgi:hypothetical protein
MSNYYIAWALFTLHMYFRIVGLAHAWTLLPHRPTELIMWEWRD